MKDPVELYFEMYGAVPDKEGEDYRLFCLALYIASKKRNRNAGYEHLDKLKRKNPKVLRIIEEIKSYANRTAQQNQPGNTKRY